MGMHSVLKSTKITTRKIYLLCPESFPLQWIGFCTKQFFGLTADLAEKTDKCTFLHVISL